MKCPACQWYSISITGECAGDCRGIQSYRSRTSTLAANLRDAAIEELRFRSTRKRIYG